MLQFGYKKNGSGLPRTGLLLYLRTPNGTGAAAGKYVATAGSASIFAALGSDWYTDVATPKALTAAEILALASVNDYHILFSAAKGLAIYDPYTTAQADIDRAHQYYRVSIYADDVPTAFFNGVDITGGIYTGGPAYAPDHLGVLRSPGAGLPAIEGMRLEWVEGPELVANGTFVTDSVWQKETGWSIDVASGKAVAVAGTESSLYQQLVTDKNDICVLILTVELTAGNIIIRFGSNVGQYTILSSGTYTLQITNHNDGYLKLYKSSTFSGTVDNISVQELIPTYLDTTITGEPILPSVEQKTRTGNTYFTEFIASTTFKKYTRTNPATDMPGFLSEPARTNKVTCRKCNPVDTSGLAASTINVTISVVSDPDILSSIYRDQCNTGKVYKAVWTGGAYIEISGAVANVNTHSSSIVAKVSNIIGSAVQFGLGNSTPKTTIVGAEYSKYLQENVTPYDSATKLVLYKPDGTGECYFILPQLEEGAFATSPICKLVDGTDPLTAITRVGTVLTYPTAGKIRSNNIAFRLTVVPRASGQNGVYIFGNSYDANNRALIMITPAAVTFRLFIAGTPISAVVNSGATHTINTPMDIVAIKVSTGMQVSCRIYSGGAWGAWSNGSLLASAEAKSSMLVGPGYTLGCFDGANQFTGNISELDTLFVPDGIPDPLAWAKAQWRLPA